MFIQNHPFFTAQRYASAVYAMALCLCLSVCHTSVFYTKTAKRRITQTTPHDSPGTLGFWCQRCPRNSTGVNPCGGGAPNAGGVINVDGQLVDYTYDGRARRGWMHEFIIRWSTEPSYSITSICSGLVVQVVGLPTMLYSTWKEFDWHIASRGPSAIAELLVTYSIVIHIFVTAGVTDFKFGTQVDHNKTQSKPSLKAARSWSRDAFLDFGPPKIFSERLKLEA